MRVHCVSVFFLILVASSHVLSISVAPRFKRVRTESKVGAVRDGIVDTFLGAMDEESYYTLHNVLKHQEAGIYSTVIVVERSSANAVVESNALTMLFERPVEFVLKSNSKLNKNNVYHAKPTATASATLTSLAGAATVTDQSFAKKFVDGLHSALAAVKDAPWESLKAKLGNDAKSNLLKQFHVYCLGTPSGSSNVAVVIRIAEMGLQPDLVWPMANPIYRALKLAGATKVNVLAIAAGGVTFHKDSPGSNHLLHKSLFVGFQVKSDGAKVAPFVALADDTKSGPTELLPANFAGTDAKENAINNADSVLDAAKVFYQDTRNDFSSVKDGPTSLTVAFFGGDKEKQRANALALQDVNMEDYFYILIAQKIRADNGATFPSLNSVAVFRVDCDPFDVAGFVTPFNTWAGTQKFMLQTDLVNIIMWGLEGQNLQKLPDHDALLWKKYLPDANTALSNAVLNKGGQDTNFVRLGSNVLHPYLLEVATDLLKDSQKVPDVPEDVKTKAQTALTSKLQADVKIFVEAWAAFLWAQRVKITQNNNDITDIGKKVPIWVRSKWFLKSYVATSEDRDKVLKTNSLEFFRATPLAVDRTFYKASNVAGLQTLNEQLFQSKRTPYDYALRKFACPTLKKTTGDALCPHISELQEILLHEPLLASLYKGTTCKEPGSPGFYALSNFCNDAITKMNKF